MAIRWKLAGPEQLVFFTSWLSAQWKQGNRPVIEVVPDKRTIDQNSLIYALYADVSKQIEDRSPLEVRCETKAMCGIPILLTENLDFREQWVRLIKERFTHEEKIELMTWFPVTSLMDKKQLSEYLERTVTYWGKQGIYLELPDQAGLESYPEAKA